MVKWDPVHVAGGVKVVVIAYTPSGKSGSPKGIEIVRDVTTAMAVGRRNSGPFDEVVKPGLASIVETDILLFFAFEGHGTLVYSRYRRTGHEQTKVKEKRSRLTRSECGGMD